MGLFNKFRSLSFEKKTLFMTEMSMGLQVLFALGKFILAFYKGALFFVAGIVTVFAILAKLETCLGIVYPTRRSLEFRNNTTSLFVCLMGILYSVYMSRLLYTDLEIRSYGTFVGVAIIGISIFEFIFAIYGCFRAYGKGHYFRNAKLIDLCLAITALVLTEIAITSFFETDITRILDGIFGVVGGVLIVIIGIYMYCAPKLTIEEHKYNIYIVPFNNLKQYDRVKVQLSESKIYGNYVYEGLVIGDQIEGVIKKERSPIASYSFFLRFILTIVIILLIVPYALGSLFFHLQGPKIVRKLDSYMVNKGYIKVEY